MFLNGSAELPKNRTPAISLPPRLRDLIDGRRLRVLLITTYTLLLLTAIWNFKLKKNKKVK